MKATLDPPFVNFEVCVKIALFDLQCLQLTVKKIKIIMDTT